MNTNAEKTDVPEYAEASKRRSCGQFSALDYFVSEWEPRLTDNDQYVIDRWREDLGWCMLQEKHRRDQVVADMRHETQKEMETAIVGLSNITLMLLSAFLVSVVANIVIIFKFAF